MSVDASDLKRSDLKRSDAETERNSQAAGRSVSVIGAGFSGLAAAHYLNKAGFQVNVYESQAEVGGLIRTLSYSLGPVETAANGLLNSKLVEELFSDVGVRALTPKPEAKKRFIYRDGQPRRWPLGLAASVSFALFVLRALFLRSSVRPRAFESVSDWGERVMGREASNYTLETALQGIYAGDAKRMSARLIFGRFFGLTDSVSKKFKKPKGRPSFRGTISVEGGMGTLIQALRESLEKRGVRFHLGKSFQFQDGNSPVEPVVIATSAGSAANLLKNLDPKRSEILSSVELLPVMSVTAFFKELCRSALGFGCLFPSGEKRKALGVLMNSVVFDGKSQAGFSETWILGGAHHKDILPDLFKMSDAEILDLIERERWECFGERSERLGAVVTRWPAALPHYTTELEKVIDQIQGPSKNVFLIGNYLGQIGLGKILERASVLADEVLKQGEWR